MLDELFKPWIYGMLESHGYTTTIKAAKRSVEQKRPEAIAAREAASNGHPVLLAADDRLVVRRCTSWDSPAVGVDESTAELLATETVTVHVPLSDESAVQCLALPDGPQPDRDAGAFLSAAVGKPGFTKIFARAAKAAASQPADDTLLMALLGQTPEPVDERSVEEWRAEAKARRERPLELDEGDDAEEHKGDEGPLHMPIDTLEISVRTFNGLMNANLRTVGDVCRRTDSELLKIKDFGPESLREIKELLAQMGLSTGMR